mmetsp:Transcript_7651/g.16005  ORF Transcript_7651/g.16005 Transcript_7651/m.16005 type:complete len:228 (+) Transcript_7651:1016-1699(+)
MRRVPTVRFTVSSSATCLRLACVRRSSTTSVARRGSPFSSSTGTQTASADPRCCGRCSATSTTPSSAQAATFLLARTTALVAGSSTRAPQPSSGTWTSPSASGAWIRTPLEGRSSVTWRSCRPGHMFTRATPKTASCSASRSYETGEDSIACRPCSAAPCTLVFSLWSRMSSSLWPRRSSSTSWSTHNSIPSTPTCSWATTGRRIFERARSWSRRPPLRTSRLSSST